MTLLVKYEDPHDVWKGEIVEDLEHEWGHPRGSQSAAHEDLMRMVSELVDDEEVLDAGCGMGHLYSLFKPRGIKYLGFDRSLDMLKVAHKFYPEGKHLFRQGDVLTAPKHFKPTDCVLCVDVLIHMTPDLQYLALQELWKLTKKTLIFTVKLGNETRTYRRKFYRGKKKTYIFDDLFDEGTTLVVQWNTPEQIYGWLDELEGVSNIERKEFEPRLQIIKVSKEVT